MYNILFIKYDKKVDSIFKRMKIGLVIKYSSKSFLMVNTIDLFVYFKCRLFGGKV